MVTKYKEPIEAPPVEEENPSTDVVQPEIAPQPNLFDLAVGLRYAAVAIGSEMQKALNRAPQHVRDALTPATDTRIHVNVHTEKWAGKTPQAAYDALKDSGYEDSLIAYVINEKCKGTKTEKGKPFLPDGSDDSVYRRKLDNLVEEATQRYTIAFHG